MHTPLALTRRRTARRRAAHARTVALLPALLAVAACGGRTAPTTALPAPARAEPLPAIPLVDGPLQLRVSYPGRNQLIESRDSNFVLGSIGNGRATLTINGAPVRVAPNGAFLAWLPVPPTTRPVYDMVATLGAQTVRDSLPVRLQPPRLLLDSAHVVDSASVAPRGSMLAMRADEPVRVSVRALPSASVWVEWDTATVAADSGRVPGRPAAAGSGAAAGAGTRPGRGGPPPKTTIPARAPSRATESSRAGAQPLGNELAAPSAIVRQSLVSAGGESWATDVRAGVLARGATLVVASGADTARFRLATPAIVDPAAPRFVVVGDSADLGVPGDTDRVVPGRPTPAGGYAWALMPGTVLEYTGRQGAFTRLRLDQQLEIWVDSEAVRPLPAGTASPRRTVGAFTLTPAREWVDVQIPIADRPAYLVEEQGNTVVLTLYGTRVAPGLIRYLENDSLVRYTVWEQVASDRARLTMHLAAAPFGYLVLYDRGTFVLRLRRRPAIDRHRPLAGLTIAVDAGHPPGGAIGPLGLTEAEAVLPVANRVAELLQARGAKVVRIRTTMDPYPLTQRPVDARRANAHAFVSVHLNAFGDGVNPFANNGSSVLYYHPQAEPLARDLDRRLIRQLGLRDLGVHFQNIAIGRTTWMPSVITEGLFLMIPEQEAAMRSPVGRERYARAVADGIEDYFRGLAQER